MCESAELIYCKKPELIIDQAEFESTVNSQVELLYDDVAIGDTGSGNEDQEEEEDVENQKSSWMGTFGRIPVEKLPNTHQCVHDYMQCHRDEINEFVCKKELSGEFCKVIPGTIELVGDGDRRGMADNSEYSFSMFSASRAYRKLNLSEIAEAHDLLKKSAFEVCLPRFDGTWLILIHRLF